MTVTSTANSISYAGNGVTTAFAFPYIFFEATDLVVTLLVTATSAAVTPAPVLNGAATYDYTVTGTVTGGEYESGGTVTFNTAPITGNTVLLVRAVPSTQPVNLIDNTKFPADTINVEFDRLTILAQQSTFLTSTALQIPSYETGLDVTADPAATRANQLLSWDALGNLSTIPPANLIGGAVPAGPASGDLAGTYPGPSIKASVALTGVPTAPTAAAGTSTTQIATTAFVATGGMRLYSETVLASPASLMSITVPTGAKSVELQWTIKNAAAANGLLEIVAMVGATPNTSAIYYTFGIYVQGGAPTVAAGTIASATTAINLYSSGSQSSGFLKFSTISNDWFGSGEYYALASSASLHSTLGVVLTLAGITGFRLRNNAGSPNFITGSSFRCFAVT